MPGLFGIVGHSNSDTFESLLNAMATALKHHDWYQVDLSRGEDYGLGRASPSLLKPDEQPVWNEDKSLCLVMEGEIFDYRDDKKKLIELGHQFRKDSHAEFVLHLFEEYGESFIAHLNGAFVVAIWDIHRKRLVIANDHLGLRPLYYSMYGGKFAFSSGVRALLVDSELPRNIDRVAIAQLFCFEYVLGNRTLLNEVQLLPPASILIFHDGNINISKYWNLHFAEIHQRLPVEEYLEGLIYYLKQAISRQAPNGLSAGINLSGGLDSRMLVELLRGDNSSNPLYTFTWGIPGCDDAHIAKEIASIASTQHIFYELKPNFLLNVADEGIELTDGMESCIHMHALANLKNQSKSVRIIYTGFLIDSLISPDIKREYWANYDDDTNFQLLFEDLNHPELFCHPKMENQFSEEFVCSINDNFDEGFRNAIDEAKSNQLADWQNNLELHQRLRRFTQNGDELLRSQVICRVPFADKHLVEFSLNLPPGLRFNRYLFREALARMNFEMAKIPWEKTGFPLVPSFRAVLIQIDQQLRWQLNKYGFKWIQDRPHHPYYDYDGWMRTALRSWVEEILLSDQCLERGYIKPESIKELVGEHMAGADHSRKLGVLISLELWHRKYVD